MKKFFFIAALALVTLFGISATVATPSDEYNSSVTANIKGVGRSIAFDTKTLVTIYNLLPGDLQQICVDSYKNISSRLESSNRSFRYAGVKISPRTTADGTDLQFSYGGHKVVVDNYTKDEFDRIFGL